MKKYKKTYSATAFAGRIAMFRTNVESMRTHNAAVKDAIARAFADQSTLAKGRAAVAAAYPDALLTLQHVTRFADMSPAEFSRVMLTAKDDRLDPDDEDDSKPPPVPAHLAAEASKKVIVTEQQKSVAATSKLVTVAAAVLNKLGNGKMPVLPRKSASATMSKLPRAMTSTALLETATATNTNTNAKTKLGTEAVTRVDDGINARVAVDAKAEIDAELPFYYDDNGDHNLGKLNATELANLRSTLPATLDYRETRFDMLGAPRSQGNCGACYAFASASVVASAISFNSGPNFKPVFELAPQPLMDC